MSVNIKICKVKLQETTDASQNKTHYMSLNTSWHAFNHADLASIL